MSTGYPKQPGGRGLAGFVYSKESRLGIREHSEPETPWSLDAVAPNTPKIQPDLLPGPLARVRASASRRG